ncbi:tetratricopeptide repeat protein [Pelagicoccus sp. NFK12]|uniref:Tetratricopeptide repeat protein n=1 Tax=Pelagicoccus enzymogenes TaxID=2773457 RepID=A0A927IIV9_9BACT|nr:transglutaminase-like domain-containing protein [Pelagicoccus enzymogenes]MBD5781666.1 tetratricopeptide repeat protein [Pelagicoccus enzymogenes]
MKLRSTLTLLASLALPLLAIAQAPPSQLAAPSLEATEEMKVFLTQNNIHSGQSPLLKMQRILDALYADDNAFTYSASETLNAEQAFQERRGNCVSFAMLFVTLAREVGLEARFNQIDYSPTWEEINGIFIETSHINAIVTVGGNQYVVEGLPEYAEVASRSRNPVSDQRVLSHYYNNSGLLALARDNIESAKAFIDRAIEIDPSNSIAWQNLGLYHFRQGNRKDGETARLNAANRSSQSASVCYLLSQYYEQTGDHAKAERFAKLGAKRSKKNPFFHYKQSRDALAAGDLKKSIKHLEKALQLLPQYTRFQLELANLKADLASEDSLARR